VKDLGCHSLHIGGGEPFLDVEGLGKVLETAQAMRVCVEYVETNSSWYQDEAAACRTLNKLRKLGLTTLLVSMSPFHNEYIPFNKVKGVIAAARLAGISIFPWIREFYPEIDSFDDKVPHRLSEYQSMFGEDYVKTIPSRYWVHFGGRALTTFSSVFEPRELSSLLTGTGCQELTDVSHFHFDLFGNYIPGLCSGLSIRMEDLGRPFSLEDYPILTTLFRSGIKGFLDFAVTQHSFKPSGHYFSKCHLCFEIKRHLVLDRGYESIELQPKGHYENS
jgi:hypothetical protein